MHQVEVDVVNVEVFEGGIKSWGHVVGVMCIIPELGSDEDF